MKQKFTSPACVKSGDMFWMEKRSVRAKMSVDCFKFMDSRLGSTNSAAAYFAAFFDALLDILAASGARATPHGSYFSLGSGIRSSAAL